MRCLRMLGFLSTLSLCLLTGRASQTPPLDYDQLKTEAERYYSESSYSRAYELYLARGRADGRDFDDWLTAERELNAADGGRVSVPAERKLTQLVDGRGHAVTFTFGRCFMSPM